MNLPPRRPSHIRPPARSFALALILAGSLLGSSPAPAAALESARVAFRLDENTGAWTLTDRRTGIGWTSNPFQPRFGEATLRAADGPRTVSLRPTRVVRERDRLDLAFQPLPEEPTATLRIRVTLDRRADALDFQLDPDPALKLDSLRLLDDALGQTATDAGYVVVPTREGLLIPADSGLAFTHRFDTYTYEGCHLRMIGVVKRGSAALLTWTDPYVAIDLRSTLTNTIAPAATATAPAPATPPVQSLVASVTLRQSARHLRLLLLGAGDYGTLARAYRTIAREQGFVVPWDRKIRENPVRAMYLGASNYKLWSALDRQMNEASTEEQRVRVNWTFDEAAQVAEHLRRDLRLDRVLFHLGGWIRRGYDNQHPDILPAAPECGGNEALADCARRVHDAGYLFCLHDNYQDIYRDAPSWDEKWIGKNPDGSLTRGGAWAGGRAYLTCSRMAFELARRPRNLEAVRQLTGVRSYFIDTTYAAGLMECHDPAHPLTRADDLKWKIALSDYTRSVFGSFGSECGREWAIPHSDFFEGLAGVSGQGFHDTGLQRKLGAAIIPFFEMVYRDCIAVHGKYGYDPAHAADYVLQHIALGRPLHYHNVPPHLYWKGAGAGAGADAPVRPTRDRGIFQRGDGGWTAGLHPYDRFVKNTHEILSPLHFLTARVLLTRHEFLDRERRVQRSVFGSGREAYESVVNGGDTPLRRTSRLGGNVELPPGGFLVEGPHFVAFLASEWGGRRFSEPSLYTVHPEDGRPLEKSRRLQVYHAFGDPRLLLRGAEHTILRETVVTP